MNNLTFQDQVSAKLAEYKTFNCEIFIHDAKFIVSEWAEGIKKQFPKFDYKINIFFEGMQLTDNNEEIILSIRHNPKTGISVVGIELEFQYICHEQQFQDTLLQYAQKLWQYLNINYL